MQGLVPEVNITHPALSIEWEAMPPLPLPLARAHAVWHNGLLYIGGGKSPTPSDLYRDSTENFSRKSRLYVYSPTESEYSVMQTPTWYFGLTVYNSNLVIVGGLTYPDAQQTSEIFVLIEGQWRNDIIPPMETKRSYPTAVGVEDMLIVAGGEDLDIVEIFKHGVWHTTTPLPFECRYMDTTLHDDHLYLFRGDNQDDEIFYCNVRSLETLLYIEWEQLDVPVERPNIISYQGILLSIGGYIVSEDTPSSSIFAFTRQSWHHIGNLPHGIAQACITQLPTGEITVIGGNHTTNAKDYSALVFKSSFRNKAAALQLSNIILSAVANGHPASLERVLELTKESFSQTDGSFLLDFLAHNDTAPSVSSTESLCSPLMIACDKQDLKMVDILLKNKASVDYKNRNNVTAVHVACGRGNLELLQKLISAFSNSEHEVRILLQMIDKKGQNILHYACCAPNRNSNEILKWLLNYLALQEFLNNTNNFGCTPLLMACDHSNLTGVEILLAFPEVDATACNSDNQTGLHLAATHDSAEISELLLERGCPSDYQDSEGNTALHVAYRKSSYSVITLFKQVYGGKSRLYLIKNKAGQIPANIEPEDIIPPEILKRGPKAVQVYLSALKTGRTEMLRCNLVILGEQRVGKTSVYRLLVLKGFDDEQDSTRGIDNTTVDALDTRQVGGEDWQEKDEHTIKNQLDLQFVQGVIRVLPSDLMTNTTDDRNGTSVSSEELRDQISDIIPSIQTIALNKHKSNAKTKFALKLKDQDQLMSLIEEIEIFLCKLDYESMMLRYSLDETIAANNNDSYSAETDTHKARSFEDNTDQTDSVNDIDDNDETHQKLVQNLSDSSDDDLALTTMSESQHMVSVPKVSNRQAKLIDQQLMDTTSRIRKAVMMYNVLDFAGQKQYRSMHHCFLVRRSIFLVVFNLQHVIHYLEKKALPGDTERANPFEEVRYWILSVHTHCPPLKDIEVVKNVLLVGTHRAPRAPKHGREIKEEELEKINDLIIEEIGSDDRCVDHIHFIVPSDQKRVFVDVENSIDGKTDEERKKSGAKMLQKQLKEIARHLPFLDEDYPVLWLRFESELARLKEILKQEDSSQVVKISDVQKLASECGIDDPEGQLVALQFFHDTGKIVYLKSLPQLFISEKEHAELADLILLDPTWLFKVMQYVVELEFRSEIKNSHTQWLNDTGIASIDLLRQCWKDYLSEPIESSFRQMCLMMQAECLIYPIRLVPEPVTLEPSPDDHESDLQANVTSEAKAGGKMDYLVPSKLPKQIKRERASRSPRWITFYFDFKGFLPSEVYHRLICLMLAVSQSESSFDNPYLSKYMCQFSRIDGCHWKVEFERHDQRLKISVLSSTNDKRSPTHHITTIHTNYLLKICTLSNFEGLRYVGGPLLDPCEMCGEKSIIRYVSYFEGEDRPSETECAECLTGYDVDKLLTDQILKSQIKATAQDDSTSVPAPKLPMTIESQTQGAAIPPSISFKEAFKVMLPLASEWQNIGVFLDLPEGSLETINADFNRSTDCLREMLKLWLKGIDTCPSWVLLANAVESFDPRIAQEIRHKKTVTD